MRSLLVLFGSRSDTFPLRSCLIHSSFKARDTLLLELASSPGRVVGDAAGRWGVGAVPESAELAATLHVFALPKFAEPSG